MYRPLLLSAIVILSLSGTSVTAAEGGRTGHQPLDYIGYYHDGSGVFPGCTPVTTWNEYDFEPIPKEQRKSKDDTERVGKQNHQNIVWKVPHYNWCNGGMIIAGGKLFALSDRGGYGFYAERAADFVGAELFCIDPDTGKELWKRDMDPWELAPNGDVIRAKILEYNRLQTAAFSLYSPLGSAMRARKSGKHLTPERYLELAEPLREHIPDLPATLADIKGHVIDNTGYEQIHFFKNIQPKYWSEVHELRQEVKKFGYLLDPWGAKPDHLGLNMQTPVSDGKHIYVATAYGGVFCLDLDGNFIWKHYLGGGWERAAAIPSPVLVDDLLIIVGLQDNEKKRGKKQTCRMALNKADGSKVWEAPYNGSYQPGPTVFSLPVAGDANNTMKVLLFPGDGTVLRANDGKQLATQLAGCWTGRPWQVDGDIVVFNNKAADGGGGKNIKNDYEPGVGAYRLQAESRDKVVAELLWQGMKLKQANLVANNGVLFHLNGGVQSYDLLTGKQIAAQKARCEESFHYTILAGKHLIGLDVKGFSCVAEVSADGKNLKFLGNNRLGGHVYGKGRDPYYARFSYGCQHFASGNRLFIRSMTDLYCIGDPQAALVLSPEHQ